MINLVVNVFYIVVGLIAYWIVVWGLTRNWGYALLALIPAVIAILLVLGFLEITSSCPPEVVECPAR